MKAFRSVFSVVCCLLLASCFAFNEELMTKPGGEMYRARGMYIGGEHDVTMSSGARWIHSLSASFKDAMQTIAATASTVYGFKAMAAAEVTKRVTEGEITKRAADQLQFQISKIQTEADVAKFMAALSAGG